FINPDFSPGLHIDRIHPGFKNLAEQNLGAITGAAIDIGGLNPVIPIVFTLPGGTIGLVSSEATEAARSSTPSTQLQQDLGAALSSAVSAANRPSVLTPYAGIIGTSKESGELVLDTFGSLTANKATTIGQGNLAAG